MGSGMSIFGGFGRGAGVYAEFDCTFGDGNDGAVEDVDELKAADCTGFCLREETVKKKGQEFS